jgi:membrane protein
MHKKKDLKNTFDVCIRFIRFVITHFFHDGCTYIASALAFTSILAIVPLMTVTLAIFSSFPVFHEFATPVQNFIFENFVPTSDKVVQSYIHNFVISVSNLSGLDILFLLIMALLVMFTIEGAMNKIWRVSNARHGAAAFLLYWSILSLTPIMLGLSIAASSYLFLLLKSSTASILIHIAPFIISLIGYIFLFTIVPNCPVNIGHAFWGAFVSSLLFEVAKQGFAYYLSRFNMYEIIYGAFATVPIFFIWVYWVWLITLLGAEISYALSVHHQRRDGHALDGFSHALLWLNELWMSHQHGKGLTFNQLIDTSHQPFLVDADEMINALIYLELIHSTADGHYMLSRDLNHMSLYDLSQLLPYRLPTHLELEYNTHHLTNQWKAAFTNNDAGLKKRLGMSLEQLFKRGGKQS